jgi:hypothetical protein
MMVSEWISCFFRNKWNKVIYRYISGNALGYCRNYPYFWRGYLLQIISTKEIYAWCKNNIGQSVQSMRKEAFSSDHKTEQKWDQIMGDA